MGKGEVGRGKQTELSLEGSCRKLTWKGRVGGGFKRRRKGESAVQYIKNPPPLTFSLQTAGQFQHPPRMKNLPDLKM